MLLENVTVEENTALGREAQGGAISFFGQDLRYTIDLKNCLLRANRSGFVGGSIACRANIDAILSNCTVIDNTAFNEGGGLFIDWGSNPTIVNSIFAGNTNYAIFDEGGLDLIGGDVVEVAPVYDQTGGTALVGATMLWEILSVMAKSRQNSNS